MPNSMATGKASGPQSGACGIDRVYAGAIGSIRGQHRLDQFSCVAAAERSAQPIF